MGKYHFLGNKYHNINTAIKSHNYNIVAKVSNDILKTRPNDCFALFNYACCLCMTDKIEEAREIFIYLISCNKKYQKYSLLNLIRLEITTGNFEMAYTYLNHFKSIYLNEPIIDTFQSFLDYKLKGDTSQIPISWYNYDRENALNYIIQRRPNNELSDFNSNIDINIVFEQAEKRLLEVPRIIAFNPYYNISGISLNDNYYFSTKNISTNKSHTCKYIKIITPPFEKNIITMFPTNELYRPNKIYEFEEYKEPLKMGRSKQIEKFNKKWNRK